MISIFVAKLDFGVDNQQLTSLFEEHGKVIKASVAIDRETGKSRGFGFVEMADDSEGHAAIDALDGSTISGRQIAVKQAEDRGPKKAFTPRDRNSGPPSNDSRPSGSNDRPSRPFESNTAPATPAFGDDDNATKARSKKLDTPKKSDKPKNHKMEAYKKSGKGNRFFADDEDEDIPSLFDYDDDEDIDYDASEYIVGSDEEYDDFDDEETDDED
ncbi:MAG: RNA recognition motif-containing protein [Lentimonas sp.]|jgi:RNA recognition motif-containing protein